MLKTCLYDDGVLNVKDLMRQGLRDDLIAMNLIQAIKHRSKDGWEAERSRKEKAPVHESMATIGG
jgi:cyclic pyranopterin phosphate synthase